jgi:small subunit ribosomal protein S20
MFLALTASVFDEFLPEKAKALWRLKMATHKSAEKRARQGVRRNVRNSQNLSAVRTFEKKVRTAIAAGDLSGAKVALNEFMSQMGKSAAKGIVHAKAAARKISRLSSRVHKMATAK